MSAAAYNPEASPRQYSRTEWITPARARDLLSRNVGNRSISKVVVKRWVDVINRHRYRLTHQGIAFDQDGNLVDGQHRLSALAASDVEGVWMQVTYEVERSTFAVMDTGHARMAGHLIPGPHATAKAATARLLLNYPKIEVPTRRIEPVEAVEVYGSLSEWIDAAVDLTHPAYRAAKVSHTMHSAVMSVVLASEYPMAHAMEWIDGVTSGAGLNPGDPRLSLRNRWAVEWVHLNNPSGATKRDGLFLLIRAWNAWASGESMTKLQLPRGGTVVDLPEVTR